MSVESHHSPNVALLFMNMFTYLLFVLRNAGTWLLTSATGIFFNFAENFIAFKYVKYASELAT